MAIDVVISRQAVLSAADRVGELSERVEVCGLVKRESFVEGQPFAVLNFEGNVAKIWIERKLHEVIIKLLSVLVPFR